MITDKFIESFNRGLASMIEFDKQTLRDQGHVFTGRLLNSLEYQITIGGNKITATFLAEDYGIDLDEGLSGDLVGTLESNQRDAKFRQWVKAVLGKTEDEVDSTIYFIWRKWKQEGFPTNNSSKFSKTGQRTMWIKIGTEMFDKRQDQFFDIELQLDVLFDQSLEVLDSLAVD